MPRSPFYVCSANRRPPSAAEKPHDARGVTPSNASKVLRELVSSAVLTSQEQGRSTTYRLANPDSPLIAELRQVFLVEATRYRELLEGITYGVPGLVSMILYGSEARGEAKPEAIPTC